MDDLLLADSTCSSDVGAIYPEAAYRVGSFPRARRD